MLRPLTIDTSVITVMQQTLSSFTVHNDTILEALSAYFLQHPDVGAYDIYTESTFYTADLESARLFNRS